MSSKDNKLKMAYQELAKAHGGRRVDILAHVLQEARFSAGATDGLFWDDLANALILIEGEDMTAIAAREMRSRINGMSSRTGRALHAEVVPRSKQGDWPWLDRTPEDGSP